ncbi:LysE family translocator [Burkholderia savannae]|uniref:LysE family translocator n=1 Tax=Burkholderia savannae TaxID=1637837 RepID=UPI001E3110E5|nr:LysE family transporter [Burkholderia savannae]
MLVLIDGDCGGFVALRSLVAGGRSSLAGLRFAAHGDCRCQLWLRARHRRSRVVKARPFAVPFFCFFVGVDVGFGSGFGAQSPSHQVGRFAGAWAVPLNTRVRAVPIDERVHSMNPHGRSAFDGSLRAGRVDHLRPDPVNRVALSAGARYGVAASLRHVAGAALGFVALFVAIGRGMHAMLERGPFVAEAIQCGVAAFLLYLAYRLAIDDGRIDAGETTSGAGRPLAERGAAMQRLNTKAWLASVAGMGGYSADGDAALVWRFAAI